MTCSGGDSAEGADEAEPALVLRRRRSRLRRCPPAGNHRLPACGDACEPARRALGERPGGTLRRCSSRWRKRSARTRDGLRARCSTTSPAGNLDGVRGSSLGTRSARGLTGGAVLSEGGDDRLLDAAGAARLRRRWWFIEVRHPRWSRARAPAPLRGGAREEPAGDRSGSVAIARAWLRYMVLGAGRGLDGPLVVRARRARSRCGAARASGRVAVGRVVSSMMIDALAVDRRNSAAISCSS